MKTLMIGLSLALALTALSGCSKGQGPPIDQGVEKEARASAMSWLKLVDEGKHDQSWEESASYFKGAITKDKWVQTIKGVRPPLGKVKSRSFDSATFTTSAPGAPDGQYVVIQYKTSFENKASATETITPMKDEDGSWKVSGYYIK